jgi:branched-chain amino acid transport system permease protein
VKENRVRENRTLSWPVQVGLAVALIVALCLVPMFVTGSIMSAFIMIMLYAYLGSCWNILGGYSGYLSFGNGAFYGIGGYTSSLLFMKFGITPWLGMLLGGLLSSLLALFIGMVSFRFRLKGVLFAFITIAFSEICLLVAANVELFGGSIGVLIPLKGNLYAIYQSTSKAFFYYVILIMLVMIVFLTRLIERNKIGIYLVAIREEERAAEALGVHANRYKLYAFIMSAFFTSLGGTFYAQYFMYIDPGLMFGFGTSLEPALRTIIGGAGTVWGPVIGSVVLELLSEVTRGLFGEIGGLHLAVYGLILILSCIYIPEGLATLVTRFLNRSTKKMSRRSVEKSP